MANEKPVDAGNDPGFPPSEPTEVPEVSTIGSAAETTVSGGLIGDAASTAENLADCLPNAGE